jgi:Domain of unknown function (DUF4388)
MRGTLHEFSLTEVIRLISEARKTGVLDLEGVGGSGRVWFRNGDICGAESTLAREPLGRKLVRAGVLSESQLWKALGSQDRTQMKIGETLVSAGLAGRDEVEAALREQVEEGIVAVLRLEPTDFTWRAEASEGDVVIVADELLATISETTEELSVIKRHIPSDRMTVAMAPMPPPGNEEITLTAEDWRILAFLGARRTVADLINYSGAGEVHMLRSLDRLISAGLVEVSDPSADPRSGGNGKHALGVGTPLAASPPPEKRPREPEIIRLPDAEIAPALTDTFSIAFVGGKQPGLSARAGAILAGHTRALPFRVAVYTFVADADVPPGPARPLEAGSLTDMDLIVGFDWAQVETAVVSGGAPPDKTFTLLELWALVDALGAGDHPDPAAARQTVARAHSRRIQHAEFMSNLEMDETGTSDGDIERLRELCASLAKSLFG